MKGPNLPQKKLVFRFVHNIQIKLFRPRSNIEGMQKEKEERCIIVRFAIINHPSQQIAVILATKQPKHSMPTK